MANSLVKRLERDAAPDAIYRVRPTTTVFGKRALQVSALTKKTKPSREARAASIKNPNSFEAKNRTTLCSIAGCESYRTGKGLLCSSHADRRNKTGSATRRNVLSTAVEPWVAIVGQLFEAAGGQANAIVAESLGILQGAIACATKETSPALVRLRLHEAADWRHEGYLRRGGQQPITRLELVAFIAGTILLLRHHGLLSDERYASKQIGNLVHDRIPRIGIGEGDARLIVKPKHGSLLKEGQELLRRFKPVALAIDRTAVLTRSEYPNVAASVFPPSELLQAVQSLYADDDPVTKAQPAPPVPPPQQPDDDEDDAPAVAPADAEAIRAALERLRNSTTKP